MNRFDGLNTRSLPGKNNIYEQKKSEEKAEVLSGHISVVESGPILYIYHSIFS